jgi:hypothetical protein
MGEGDYDARSIKEGPNSRTPVTSPSSCTPNNAVRAQGQGRLVLPRCRLL